MKFPRGNTEIGTYCSEASLPLESKEKNQSPPNSFLFLNKYGRDRGIGRILHFMQQERPQPMLRTLVVSSPVYSLSWWGMQTAVVKSEKFWSFAPEAVSVLKAGKRGDRAMVTSCLRAHSSSSCHSRKNSPCDGNEISLTSPEICHYLIRSEPMRKGEERLPWLNWLKPSAGIGNNKT